MNPADSTMESIRVNFVGLLIGNRPAEHRALHAIMCVTLGQIETLIAKLT